MRRAMSPATCTQVRSWPSSRWIQRALRSLASEALSSAALTKAPPKYQRSFTVPSAGARLECTLNTFMKTLTLSASRLRYGSLLRLTSTMRPSAGETTAAGSSGASRGGSRKNCRMNTVASHSGADHQPSHHAASADTASAARRYGQPSRAMIGCGQGGVTRCLRFSVPRRVDQAVLLDPRHHLAQPRADLLDRQLRGHAPARQQHRRPGTVLEDELLGVFARLDAVQDLLHALARALVDHLGAGNVFAVFGVVRDRVVHRADAALVHQVDDELQLMQALEIRHLGRIAGLDQRVEARLHQLDAAAAEHRLLAEEIGLGLFLEVGLDDAGLAAADRRGIGKREVAGLAGAVAMHRDQHRHAAAPAVGRAHGVARCLRRHHPYVEVLARLDQAVVNVEAVRECERRAFPDIGLDVLLVDGGVVLVGQQHHDDVGALDRLVDLSDLDATLLRLVPGRAALAQSHAHLHAGLLQILGVGMALGAVAENGDLLALDQ